MAEKDKKPVRECSECGRSMVSHYEWKIGNPRRAQTYCHKDNGLCRACDQRAERRANPRPRKTARRIGHHNRHTAQTESYLEEYDSIRSGVSTIAQAAVRMGITVSRLEMMLYRARKRGDARGRPPTEQVLRAQAVGAPFGRRAPHRPAFTSEEAA